MAKKILVLGVSGSGKSLIGSLLAKQLGYPFFDGDDFHSPESVEKMRCGQPLTDEDRKDWLLRLNRLIHEEPQLVVACSALKPEYRDTLRQGNETLRLVYLKGSFDTIWQRHQQRDNHYFRGKDMLESQFETLVEPENNEALVVDIATDPDTILQAIQGYLMTASQTEGESQHER